MRSDGGTCDIRHFKHRERYKMEIEKGGGGGGQGVGWVGRGGEGWVGHTAWSVVLWGIWMKHHI